MRIQIVLPLVVALVAPCFISVAAEFETPVGQRDDYVSSAERTGPEGPWNIGSHKQLFIDRRFIKLYAFQFVGG